MAKNNDNNDVDGDCSFVLPRVFPACLHLLTHLALTITELGALTPLILQIRKLSTEKYNILFFVIQLVSDRVGLCPEIVPGQLVCLIVVYFCAATMLFSILQLYNKLIIMTSFHYLRIFLTQSYSLIFSELWHQFLTTFYYYKTFYFYKNILLFS